LKGARTVWNGGKAVKPYLSLLTGAEVVAAKRIWTGGGLYKQPKRDWPIYKYVICSSCNRFLRRKEEEEIPSICSCGTRLKPPKTFVIPEFGFVAARNILRSPGESRPQRLYASRVYFTKYATIQQERQLASTSVPEDIKELSSRQITISRYYSRFGKLALVDEGVDQRGFRICPHCGFAEMAPSSPAGRPKRSSQPKAHSNPRTGKHCDGLMYTHQLGHEFLTDVVEIRFEGYLASSAQRTLWRSLLYALLEGASEALSIRRDDLDGTIYWPNSSKSPAIILFDNVPGGAGHVKRIADEMQVVFQKAYERVNHDCCGPETSCYECLRNYRNQPYHDKLARGITRDFLAQVLEAVGISVR
jgi:hypothetical protein